MADPGVLNDPEMIVKKEGAGKAVRVGRQEESRYPKRQKEGSFYTGTLRSQSFSSIRKSS